MLRKNFPFDFEKVKTDAHWRVLWTRDFFEEAIAWQTIYYYFNKSSKDGIRFANEAVELLLVSIESLVKTVII